MLLNLRGSGGGGSSSQHTPVESPDSLHSVAYARVLDLVSEGEIVGLVGGLTGVYFNSTPLQNIDGSLNFKNVQVDSRTGTQNQPYITGFPSVENQIFQNVELIYGTPFVRASTNLALSAVRVTLSVPGLSQTDTKTGDTHGYLVEYAIDVSTDGGAYVQVLLGAFNGKTTSKYQRIHRIDLPTAVSTGWNIRVRRTTAQGTSSAIIDKTYVDAITEVIDIKLRYPNSALVGVTLDSSQFSNIPVRGYHLKGRIIQVPSNYNAVTRQYTGVWNGTFQNAYSNNPAWVFYDLATHTRYGLGNYVTPAQVDKWSLYSIAQYCDGFVPTGILKRGAFTTGSTTLAAAPATAGQSVTGSYATGLFTATAHGFAANDPVTFTSALFATGLSVTGAKATGIFTATAHGFAVNDQVQFYSITGGGGITQNAVYYVIAANLAANTFSVSATTGGASIAFTSDMTAGTVSRKSGVGVTLGGVYYVIAAGLTANVFAVSATYGGASITFSADMSSGTVTRSSNYTRSAGSFLTDGFLAGDEIGATGFATAGNNGRGTVVAVSALQLVIGPDHVLTTDAAAAGCTIAVQNFTEPRFSCNCFLQSQADAFKVLQDMASVFRGISYWSGGAIMSVADQPGNPVYTYTAANVVDGKFVYTGSAKKTRSTVALVSWNDPKNFYKAAVEYVEDLPGIARYGVQQTQVTAFGCSSQSQAKRVGLWTLLTGRLETDLVTFSVGLDGTFAMPGQIIRIADPTRAGKRIAGRITAINGTTSATVDAVAGINPGDSFIVQMPDTTLQTRTVSTVVGNVITPTVAFSPALTIASIWVTESVALVAQTYRVLSVTEGTGLDFNITALKHNDSKFAAIETGAAIEIPPITSLPNPVQLPVTNVTLSSFERASNFASHTVVEATWPYVVGAVAYAIQWQKDNGDWTTPVRKAGNRADYENAFAGTYIAKVVAVGPNGQTSPPFLSAAITVAAASTPPIDSTPIALSIVAGVARVNCAIGNHFTLALNANATLSFVGVPPSDRILIEVTQTGGGFTLGVPSSVIPVTGTPYVASTANGALDLLDLSTSAAGTPWLLTYTKGSAFVVTLSPSPASGTANSVSGANVSPSVTVTATEAGGTAPITRLWTRADSGTTNFVISSTTAAAPTFSIASGHVVQSYSNQWLCTSTDNVGKVTSALVTITLSVTSSGSPPLTISASPSDLTNIVKVGHAWSQNVTASLSGGTGIGQTYAWTKTGTDAASYTITNPSSATCTLSLPSGTAYGTYACTLTCTGNDSGATPTTVNVAASVELSNGL